MDSRKIDDDRKARSLVLALERKSAAERMAEYAETIDFPVLWDAGAPMPHLLTNGYRTILVFYVQGNYSENDLTEPVASLNSIVAYRQSWATQTKRSFMVIHYMAMVLNRIQHRLSEIPNGLKNLKP